MPDCYSPLERALKIVTGLKQVHSGIDEIEFSRMKVRTNWYSRPGRTKSRTRRQPLGTFATHCGRSFLSSQERLSSGEEHETLERSWEWERSATIVSADTHTVPASVIFQVNVLIDRLLSCWQQRLPVRSRGTYAGVSPLPRCSANDSKVVAVEASPFVE